TSGAPATPPGPPGMLMGRKLKTVLSFRPINRVVRRGWRVDKALVTGGHGFVGSHLAAGLLAAGDAVRVLDRPGPRQTDLGGPRASGLDLLGVRDEIELVEADLLDAESVAAATAGCDSVFHLAAQTIVGVARRCPHETVD